jgi:hypothetical protein
MIRGNKERSRCDGRESWSIPVRPILGRSHFDDVSRATARAVRGRVQEIRRPPPASDLFEVMPQLVELRLRLGRLGPQPRDGLTTDALDLCLQTHEHAHVVHPISRPRLPPIHSRAKAWPAVSTVTGPSSCRVGAAARRRRGCGWQGRSRDRGLRPHAARTTRQPAERQPNVWALACCSSRCRSRR